MCHRCITGQDAVLALIDDVESAYGWAARQAAIQADVMRREHVMRWARQAVRPSQTPMRVMPPA